MKKIYGVIALLILNLACFFFIFQFFYFENTSWLIKGIVMIIVLVIDLGISLGSLKVLGRRYRRKTNVRQIKRIQRKKLAVNIVLTLLCVVLCVGNYYYLAFNRTIAVITSNLAEPAVIHCYAYVKKDSSYQDLADPDLTLAGMAKDERADIFTLYTEAISQDYQRTNNVDYMIRTIDNTNDLYQQLINDKVQVILIGDQALSILKSNYPQFEQNLRCIDSRQIKTAVDSVPVNVAKEPFTVLIMGVDVREYEGDIYTKTRTDTLMLATFNPHTMQLSLISIPRDSYVPLTCKDNAKDKITHAGTSGTSCTIETVEKLLGIEINYYAKFNFNALVDLVDAVGGVQVDVQYSFTEQNSQDVPDAISVQAGLQTLDGEEALAYARHRKTQNDHVRNAAQQQVLSALLQKLASPQIITRLDALMGIMQNNMTTNLNKNEIYSLAGLLPQLNSLSIDQYVLEGEDIETYVPLYDQNLWITQLDDESIQLAKAKIHSIMTDPSTD